MTETNYKYTN